MGSEGYLGGQKSGGAPPEKDSMQLLALEVAHEEWTGYPEVGKGAGCS